MSKLLVYTTKVTERIKYAFDLVLVDQLGLSICITDDFKKFEEFLGFKLNYSNSFLNDSFNISCVPLLFELDINERVPSVGYLNDLSVLYKTDGQCDLGFDIFAACFYLVSRYEEYLPFKSDRFGRYRAEDSIAFKNGFVKKPLVNIWCDFLMYKLAGQYSSLTFQTRSYKYLCTLDIDNAYAYKGKGLTRNIGGVIKDLVRGNASKIIERVLVLSNLKKDPFDTFDFQEEILSRNKLDSIYFFLLGDYGPYDKNLPHTSAVLRGLIKRCAQFSKVGIHPSFASNSKKSFAVEASRLNEILGGQHVTKSRQHYLKMTLPETYLQLIECGIREDYTMGHASVAGFRASICTPFFFFNLRDNKVTDLKIFPLAIMEGTLKQYMNLSPEIAIEEFKEVIEEVKKVNGFFISLWHNDSLSDKYEWKGWKKVFKEMISLAKS